MKFTTTREPPHPVGPIDSRQLGRRTVQLLLLPLVVAACATFEPQAIDLADGSVQIYTQTRNDVTVSSAILPDAQAQRLYGADLARMGLQAIWLRIENHTDHAHWLLVSGVDSEYFAPDEAAVLFKVPLKEKDEERLVQHFRKLAIPMKTAAGETTEGYVLAPRHEGGRYLHVALAGTSHVLEFGFAVTLPDGEFDFELLEPSRIYAGQERPDLNLEELRAALQTLPCCTSDKNGTGQGDPLNLVLIGNIDDLFASLSRSDWSFTHRLGPESIKRLVGATLSGTAYSVAPVSSLYLYGRSQDIALQHSRNTVLQRNHLRLWLAPFRHVGRSVWVGQVSRDIDIKLTTLSPTLTTHVVDPNVDESREHLLQSLMITGAMEWFAFVDGVPPATEDQPHQNLTADPYFTDGLRLVANLSGSRSTPTKDIRFLEWNNSVDPIIQY